MKEISKEQIIKLHTQLVEETGGSVDIRDEGMLDSAVSAPYASFAGIEPFPTVIEKASRLGFGLIKNHPFIDGNKRIGAHALILMLKINGVTIDYDDQDLIDTILKVADGSFGYEELLAWVKAHIA
ncbi:MAG: type II toxin-antitoxin system death-on-curing family toxin [Lachnospiraceae bacterium]|nr:type II toxin-antitoxin system death-on-curing family toxin [Lachnospiraceae bacterium]